MIVLLLTTRNECDVLRLNLQHHLGWGVDHVCVADNASEDATAEVVRAFGRSVSYVRFGDFARRQSVRTHMLREAEARHGRAAWVGVSDTDEFWWTPAAGAPHLLRDVPADVPCATFRQKLFLPSESDAPSGPVYARLLHRAGSERSRLFRSYPEGKSWYRGAALRRVASEHRNPDVPGAVWWHPEPALHHYMIRDEDQFVMKVRRLAAWRPRTGLASKRWYHRVRALSGMRPPRPFVAAFKREWWDVFERGGEAALREYFRTSYRVRTEDLPRHLEAGELVRDTAFAEFRAAADAQSPAGSAAPARPGAEVPSA